MFGDQTLRVKSSLTHHSPTQHHSRTSYLLPPPPSLFSLLCPRPILSFFPSFLAQRLECPFSWSSRGDSSLLSWNSQGNCLWFYLKLLTTNVFVCRWWSSSRYFVLVALLLRVHLFLLRYSSNLDLLALLHALLFSSWPFCYVTLFLRSWPSCIATMHCSLVHDPLALLCCAAPQLLTLLCCYVKLVFSFWPSYVVVLCCSSTFDLLVLLQCVASQFLTFLHYVLLFNSWPSYDVFQFLTLLCCSSVFDPLTLFLSSWPSYTTF